jgi:ribosomal protein S18 acetylase RimI-like enzyme
MTEARVEEDRHVLLAGAANPRRARETDARALARLLAAAFQTDPVFDWMTRPGPRRAIVMEEFFFWILRTRAIPFGEVWMSEGVVAVWIPPDAPASPGGFVEQLRLLPLFWRLCGLPRLGRGAAIGEAMEKSHPHESHFYLAFLAVAPRLQGMGLGGTLLETTIRQADENRWACYLENSNPRNTRLYERLGFMTRRNIAPAGAPPMMAMWRPAQL